MVLTHGNLPNWTGNFQVITANLNNWSFDNNGRAYAVQASLNLGAPSLFNSRTVSPTSCFNWVSIVA
ncbi:MAG: hypothetical protein IPN94_08810 [Sphingobacteriales bacterium]|nr:hypothetical protein [Sphingobacteriales bacterium]